jgi:hypothetical protein
MFGHLQDAQMATLLSPFGMDPDGTQNLVLVTAELFRLQQQLKIRMLGLEEILMNKSSAESRRKRYDRMKVRRSGLTGSLMSSHAT